MIVHTLVSAGGRPNSNFRFMRMGGHLPPVFRLLCHLSREIPAMKVENSLYLVPHPLNNMFYHFHSQYPFFNFSFFLWRSAAVPNPHACNATNRFIADSFLNIGNAWILTSFWARFVCVNEEYPRNRGHIKSSKIRIVRIFVIWRSGLKGSQSACWQCEKRISRNKIPTVHHLDLGPRPTLVVRLPGDLSLIIT